MWKLPILLIASVAGSHLLLLLQRATLLERPRQWLKQRHPLLRELIECQLCLGFWTSLAVGIAAGIYQPVDLLAVAGLSHLVTLVRERFLPCEDCSKAVDTGGWKVVNK